MNDCVTADKSVHRLVVYPLDYHSYCAAFISKKNRPHDDCEGTESNKQVEHPESPYNGGKVVVPLNLVRLFVDEISLNREGLLWEE